MNDFNFYYDQLPSNLQCIIERAIANCKKIHKFKNTTKQLDLSRLLKFYLKENNISQAKLLEKCYDIDPAFSESTFKSIVNRNLKNIKDNPTLQTVAKILNIPSDENGLLYIDYGISKSYPFTDAFYEHMTEFQRNNIYQNFSCLSEKDQNLILTLTHDLYINMFFPELFTE